MRISQEQMVSNALERHRSKLEQYEGVQAMLGSGKRIERPSEGPGTMSGIFSLRAAQKARAQEERNSQEAMTWVNLGDAKLQDASKAVQRARELVVRSGSPLSPEERSAIASEILGLRDELVALANSKHLGQGLFAGFAASDAVTKVAGSWVYSGDAGQVTRRIGEGETVTVNVIGADVFGFAGGEDVLTVLEAAATNIQGGDAAAINGSLAKLEIASGRILDGVSRLGATGTRLERVLLRNQAEQGTLKGELSLMEDADLGEAVMDLQMQEVGYQASLAAMSRVLLPSLVDFLR